ncbi:nucleotide sugar dehydrogenase [Haloarchaeobius sp. TZWWS8]|uniref:nucleotide sugar dehydrogenase n=1 Tax=Haloarchaeobius sp. TZWWS8 TaxID=3446121 RepID=UPI003EBF041A
MTTVTVHGLGYIGLPTAAILADAGHEVHGFDVDDDKVSALRNGEVFVDEDDLTELVRGVIEDGSLVVDTEPKAAEVHIVCVPTPLDDETKEANLAFVEAAGETIADLLREDDLVILESTVPPTTTTDTLRPILDSSGLTAGEDYDLCFSPETVLPGNTISELRGNDRIVGGVTRKSAERAKALYETFVESEVATTDDPTVAEFVKLAQNTYRDTNIALANELAKVAHDYDIDAREAIEHANMHPRVNVHLPGPGVGGHCLPIDPWFFGHGSDSVDLITHAREVNDSMTGYVRGLLEDELGSLDDKTVAVFGLAYKGGVADTRESPGLSFVQELQAETGATVQVHDPFVDDTVFDVLDEDAALSDADALVVTTDHPQFADLSPESVRSRMAGSVVIDTKAILDPETWRSETTFVRL